MNGVEEEEIQLDEIEKEASKITFSNILIYPPLPTTFHPHNIQNQFANSIENSNLSEIKPIIIPSEILRIIIQYCDGNSLLNLSLVCKEIYKFCKEENEKFRSLFLEHFYPFNKLKYKKFVDIFTTLDDFQAKKYQELNAPLPRFSSSLSSLSFFDPYYHHNYFWKDLYFLRKSLAPFQSNPIKYLDTDFEIDIMDIRLCEFFRISKKILRGKPFANEEGESRSNTEEEFHQVELAVITPELKPVRLLVRFGKHPSLAFAASNVEEDDFLQIENDEDGEEEEGDGVGEENGEEEEEEGDGEENEDEEEGDEEENGEEGDEDKEEVGKKRKRKMGKEKSPRKKQKIGSKDEWIDAYEIRDELEKSEEILKGEFEDIKYFGCPCSPEDETNFEIFIWNFVRGKYFPFSRSVNGHDSVSHFKTVYAELFEKIIYSYDKNDKIDQDGEKREIWETRGGHDGFSLAALCSAGGRDADIYFPSS